ncbi:hypothetical protein [Robertmurraya sp. P23]
MILKGQRIKLTCTAAQQEQSLLVLTVQLVEEGSFVEHLTAITNAIKDII